RPGNLAFKYALPFVGRPGVLRQLKHLFDEFRPDVVHQNGQFFDLTFLTTWVAWRRRIPRVLTVHTPLVHTSRVLNAIIAGTERTLLRVLNAPGRPVIVGVHRFVCEVVERRYGRGDVRFVPAALHVEAFAGGDDRSVRAHFDLDDAPVILSFGHVIPLRNRVRLMQALPYIVKEFPDVKVLIVGEVLDDEFMRVAERLEVADHVISAGAIAHRWVPDFLAAASVECHDLEGQVLGITTLESMAAGVPVVGRVRRDVFPGIDLDEWPELRIVEQAEPEDIADAICELLRSPDLRERVAAQQFDFVDAHFRADAVARQYVSIFDELLATEARR
ncbi:MAG TPA: glycosyltransferase family 4 protein, partial [Ilumatobacteraceae bacterium]|nr:glycosyltransferase family 4 protein [Ilumatobacteraceae bacterium]